MGQFSVHANPDPGSRAEIPFLLDGQAEVVDALATRVVVPLYRLEGARSRVMTRLTPVLSFQGEALVAMVPELAGLPRRRLGPELGDLVQARVELLGALDLLVTGF